MVPTTSVESRPGAGRWIQAISLGAFLFLLVSVVLLLAPGAARAASTTPLTGSVTGPTVLADGGKAIYVLNATGGPAFAPNGTQVGILSYHATFSASNTTGGSFSPPAGVLVNGSAEVTFLAPNVTESVLLTFEVNSSYQQDNATINLTYSVSLVQPFRFTATIVVVGAASVASFPITINLDGRPVGTVVVPSLTAGASYPVSFAYATNTLGSGWHTFSMTVTPEHGLVRFTTGAESVSASFYIEPAPTDYTWYYVLGAATAVAAILILVLRLGPRRPKKK